MLSDEEKKAIDYIKNEIKAFETVITAMEKEIDDKNWLRKNILEIKEDISVRETVLNLIEKQSKEIEELKEENEKYKNPPFFDEDNYTENDKIKAKIEEYKKQIEKMEKDDIGIGFTLGKEWSDLKAKVEFGQLLLEKE